MEQFLYGLFQDGNYVFLKSPGVNQLLRDASIQYLRQRQSNDNTPIWLPTEQVVAIQYITHAKDGTGRNGMWNSTLLFSIDEYIRATQPYVNFHDHFITCEDDVPPQLPSVRL
jgi:hypothetical protein